MRNNLDGQNAATLMDKEEARDYLENIGFFNVHENKEQFEAGEIEVYNEPWANEAHVIININEKRVIIADDRSM